MTVVAQIMCDEPGCETKVHGLTLPEDWEVIPMGSDPGGLPKSKHFCPVHIGSERHRELLRSRED